jgi:hypothetical protein
MLRYLACATLLALAIMFFKIARAFFQAVYRITASAVETPAASIIGSETVEPTPIDYDVRLTLNERSWSLH